MTNPYAPGKIGVTIKVPESKKYAGDNPWFVFEGTSAEDLKAKIADTFGISTEGLTLADTVVNAQRLATSLGNVAHGLGGTVMASSPAGSSQAPSSDVWSQVNAEQAKGSFPYGGKPSEAKQEPTDPVLSAIEGCTSVAELQQVWAENQSAFNANAAYMDAYKAKGRALSGN